jgi:adenosylcobyric acid synthase
MSKVISHRLTLMVQGTTSDAGKSVLVAGLCRLLHRQGYKVAPFKPQNMALNSAVTLDGGEIGRAQAVQAQACGLEPHSDMNPVLIKPSSDTGAQIIIHGQAVTDMNASAYHDYKKVAMQAVLTSYQRLKQQYEVIIVEGAGSPAEINLRDNDIANMSFAEAIDCPVIIIADIDRGGVFAHLYGTLALLDPSEQERVTGFIINRFRGDITLLKPGLDWLETMTDKPVLGVLPYLHNFHLEAEDAINTSTDINRANELIIIVPVLPRISNHTDFDALRLHPQVVLHYVGQGQAIPAADLIIIPGSKNVRDDLQWLKLNGWPETINKHLRYGGKLIGICGGLQMLGQWIHDPDAIEGHSGSTEGLGLFPYETILKPQKQLKKVHGCFHHASHIAVTGYEIHAGITTGIEPGQALLQLDNGQSEGIISRDGQLMASYLHGLFDHPQACEFLLEWAGLSAPRPFNYAEIQEQSLELLADTLKQTLDMQKVLQGL